MNTAEIGPTMRAIIVTIVKPSSDMFLSPLSPVPCCPPFFLTRGPSVFQTGAYIGRRRTWGTGDRSSFPCCFTTFPDISAFSPDTFPGLATTGGRERGAEASLVAHRYPRSPSFVRQSAAFGGFGKRESRGRRSKPPHHGILEGLVVAPMTLVYARLYAGESIREACLVPGPV